MGLKILFPLAGERRRGRPRKNAQVSEEAGSQQSSNALTDVPQEVLQQMAASNPRQNASAPTDGVDLSYD